MNSIYPLNYPLSPQQTNSPPKQSPFPMGGYGPGMSGYGHTASYSWGHGTVGGYGGNAQTSGYGSQASTSGYGS